MALEKLSPFEYVRDDDTRQDRGYRCYCCHDTGLVVLSHELRDESGDCLAQMLPPLHCKNCDALTNKLFDSIVKDPETGDNRPPTYDEVMGAIEDRYDIRANKLQCAQLHERGKADYATRGKTPNPDEMLVAATATFAEIPDGPEKFPYSEADLAAFGIEDPNSTPTSSAPPPPPAPPAPIPVSDDDLEF